jgi:hypothetical protein
LVELSVIDVKSVFALQRVNAAFNDTINTTKKIRRNICLNPLLETEEEALINLKPNPLCSDKRIGALLRRALLHAWTNSAGMKQAARGWVELPYSMKTPIDWQALQHGSWRSTKFAQTAKSLRVRVGISIKDEGRMFWRAPRVDTHTTLGEIVDRFVEMAAREK